MQLLEEDLQKILDLPNYEINWNDYVYNWCFSYNWQII